MNYRKIMRSSLFTGLLLLIMVASSHATTYFVKADGNDSLDGRSDRTAWKTISKVNGFNFNTGDDVYFKCGDTYTISASSNRLDIDWSGTASNIVEVGAYFMDGDSEKTGVNNDGKPIIDGQNRSYPVSIYSGLIHADGSYIQITDLAIQDSHGYGVAAYSSSHISVSNCLISGVYCGAILYKNSSYCSAIGNIIYNSALIYSKAGGAQETRPGTVQLHTSSYNLISKNKIHESWGEGVGVYHGSHYNKVEFNEIYSVWAAGIYLDASHDNTVSYNLIFGRGKEFYARDRIDGIWFTGNGIWVDDEPGHITSTNYQSNNIFLGNLVAFCASGIAIGTSDSSSIFKNSKIYHNTLVDNAVGIHIYEGPFSNSQIANNIIWQPSGDPDYSGPSSTTGISWHNNSWSQSVAPPDNSPSSLAGDPMLEKSTGWRSSEMLYARDFSLKKESPLIGKGIALDDDYSKVLDLISSDYKTATFYLIDQRNSGTTWNIGADTRNPLQPPILSICSN